MRYSPAVFMLATAAMALPANLAGETSAAAHEATVENVNLWNGRKWGEYKRDNQAAHEATVENDNLFELGEGWIDVKRDNQAAQ